MITYVILAVMSLIGGVYYFYKYDNYREEISLDKENVEKAKNFFKLVVEKLRIKKIFVMTLGEIFNFIQELPSREARSKWNVRKELMFIMLIGLIFYVVINVFDYTYTPYIVFALVVLVIFVLRKTGHLKKTKAEKEKLEVEKTQEETGEKEENEEDKYKDMSDLQIGFAKFKELIVTIYDLTLGSVITFADKVITREGRKDLLLEQELILVTVTTIPYVYYGWDAFYVTIIYIIGDYLVELLRGRHDSCGENKEAVNPILSDENKKLTADLEKANQKVDELTEQNKVHQAREEEVQEVLSSVEDMTKAKEIKEALVVLQKKRGK